MSSTNTQAASLQNPEDLELTITRTFDAPRTLVFKMWTAAEHLSQWFCPPEFTLASITADFQPGGAWHLHMTSPDDSSYKMGGVYRGIVANEQIVMTQKWLEGTDDPDIETVITVDFADHGEKTELTFHQAVLESKASRDSRGGGWTKFLDNLESQLENA